MHTNVENSARFNLNDTLTGSQVLGRGNIRSKLHLKNKSSRKRELACTTMDLAGHFLQQFLIDIKVGMNVLHVVVLFQSFDQANHGCSLRTF